MNVKIIFWLIGIFVSAAVWWRPLKSAFAKGNARRRVAYILGFVLTFLAAYAIAVIIYLYTHRPLIPFL